MDKALTPLADLALDLYTEEGIDYASKESCEVPQEDSHFDGYVGTHISAGDVFYTNDAAVRFGISEIIGYAEDDEERKQDVTLMYLYSYTTEDGEGYSYDCGGTADAEELKTMIRKHMS